MSALKQIGRGFSNIWEQHRDKFLEGVITWAGTILFIVISIGIITLFCTWPITLLVFPIGALLSAFAWVWDMGREDV